MEFLLGRGDYQGRGIDIEYRLQNFFESPGLFDVIIFAHQTRELAFNLLFPAAEACQTKRIYTAVAINAHLAAGEKAFLADVGMVAEPSGASTRRNMECWSAATIARTHSECWQSA